MFLPVWLIILLVFGIFWVGMVFGAAGMFENSFGNNEETDPTDLDV